MNLIVHSSAPTLALPRRRGREWLPPLRSGGGLGWGPHSKNACSVSS